MRISLILAVADNGVLGRRGTLLPWHLRADLHHFRHLTTGHPIIMGRKTYATIGMPLPNRHNIIISANPGFRAEGCTVVRSLAAALDIAGRDGTDEVFVTGGAAIYELALPQADRIYLTQVHGEPEGDVHFSFDRADWQTQSSESHRADAHNDYDFTWEVLSRKSV